MCCANNCERTEHFDSTRAKAATNTNDTNGAQEHTHQHHTHTDNKNKNMCFETTGRCQKNEPGCPPTGDETRTRVLRKRFVREALSRGETFSSRRLEPLVGRGLFEWRSNRNPTQLLSLSLFMGSVCAFLFKEVFVHMRGRLILSCSEWRWYVETLVYALGGTRQATWGRPIY